MIEIEQRARATRFRLTMAIVLIASGGLLLALRYDLKAVFFPYADSVLVATMCGLALLTTGVAAFMLLYLRGEISFRLLDNLVMLKDERDDKSIAFDQRIAEVASTVEQLKSAQLGALGGNREELIAALRPTLLTDVANELEAKFAAAAIDAARLNEIRRSFDSSHQRLRLELSS
jgi:hypothetical protein